MTPTIAVFTGESIAGKSGSALFARLRHVLALPMHTESNSLWAHMRRASYLPWETMWAVGGKTHEGFTRDTYKYSPRVE